MTLHLLNLQPQMGVMLLYNVLRNYALTILLFLFLVGPVLSDPITKEMRRDDPNLEKEIILIRPRASIGEFLMLVSAQSGVTVAAEETDGAGDVPVSVFLRRVRVADAMNAVWALVSHKGAAWAWTRVPKSEGMGFRYVLSRPAAARGTAANLNRFMQEEFEGQAERLLSAANDPAGKGTARDAEAEMLRKHERLRQGVQVLSEITTTETRRQILRGQTALKVPVSQLSPRGQEFVRTVWKDTKATRPRPDGTTEPAPQPTWIEALRITLPGETSPSLFLMMEGIGGYNYVGGLPLKAAVQERMHDLWTLPGDSVEDARMENDTSAKPDVDVPPPPEDARQQIEAGPC